MSDYPELEDILSFLVEHLLLGSAPRRARISRGVSSFPLADIDPATFNPRLLKVGARFKTFIVPF